MALSLLQGYDSDSSSENEAGALSSTSVSKSELLKSPVPAKNVHGDQIRKADVSAGTDKGASSEVAAPPGLARDSLVFENPMNRLDADEKVLCDLENSVNNMSKLPFEEIVNRISAITEGKFSEQQIRGDKYGSDGEKSSSTDSADDSDNNWESFDDSDDDILGNSNSITKSFSKSSRPFLKVKGELGLEDLPPIEDLKISVPHQDCEVIGSVYNIVDKLVIVQSLPNKPSLDLDTVLFLDNGTKVLGQIFDVFGQINEPFYSIRFNSVDHIKENKIDVGLSVYYAPKTDHTRFIVVSDLMRLKGSDASWQHDLEMPPEFLDYSDDEKEREAKKEYQRRKSQTEGGNPTNSNKRHKPTEFEEKMNRKNLLKTAEWNRKKKQNAQRQWMKQRPFNPFGYENNVFNSNYETAEINWATSSNQNSSGLNQQQTSNNFNSSHLPSIYNVVPQFNSTTFIRPPRLSISPIFRHMPPSMNYQNNYPSNVHIPGFYPHLATGNVQSNLPNNAVQNATTSMPFSPNNPMNFTSPPPIAPPHSSSFNRGSSQSNSNQINNPMWSVYSFPAPPGT